MENRRDFLRLSAVGIAALAATPTGAPAATPAGAATGAPSEEASPEAPSPPATTPDWLFAPLSAGSAIGFGWMFARAFAPVNGGITVNLVHHDGRAARVDLCQLEGRGKGPACSALCDFIVMDGGDGRAPMDEELGRALTRLAAVVAENEATHPDAVQALVALEAHADRVWRHPDAMSVASRQLTPATPSRETAGGEPS